jgi:iron complex transport system permease protein
MKRHHKILLISLLATLVLFIWVLCSGDVDLSIKKLLSGELSSTEASIFWDIRLPKAITALLAGAALAISGAIMQTYFQNPLAGPFVLGIHSGASLGVALWIMGAGLLPMAISETLYSMGSVMAAITGSLAILFVLLILSRRLPGKVAILVLGLIFGYLANGLINIMISLSNAHQIKAFLMWSLGSFQRVSGTQLNIFALIIIIGLAGSFFFIKPLNLLLLGERYARSSGLKLNQTRFIVILLVAILSGTVTAFCGPIAFIGIIVPHVARKLVRTNDHRYQLPVSLLLGCAVALVAEILSSMGGAFLLPLNAILGLMGAPLIFFFFLGKRKEEAWQ